MSIFGDETITPPGSPDASGQDEGGAGQAGNEDALDNGFQDHEDDGFEGGEVDEQDDNDDADDDGDDGSSPDGSGQGDNGLILGKFKSTDDLAKAYQSLQSEFTKSRQGAGGQQQQAQPPAPQGNTQDQNQAFWNAFKDNPLATIQALVTHAASQQVAPLIEDRQTETLGKHFDALGKEYKQLGTDEGMQKFAEAIRDVATELGNPDLARNPTPRMLRMAALEAFGDSKAKAYERGKQDGRQESERTRQSKQGLGAKSGAKPGKNGGEPTLEQSIKDSILAAGKGGGGIWG